MEIYRSKRRNINLPLPFHIFPSPEGPSIYFFGPFVFLWHTIYFPPIYGLFRGPGDLRWGHIKGGGSGVCISSFTGKGLPYSVRKSTQELYERPNTPPLSLSMTTVVNNFVTLFCSFETPQLWEVGPRSELGPSHLLTAQTCQLGPQPKHVNLGGGYSGSSKGGGQGQVLTRYSVELWRNGDVHSPLL